MINDKIMIKLEVGIGQPNESLFVLLRRVDDISISDVGVVKKRWLNRSVQPVLQVEASVEMIDGVKGGGPVKE